MPSIREYVIFYVRGTRVGGTIVSGGNAVLSTGQHALDGPEHTSLDAYAKAFHAGEEGFVDHGDAGASITLDATDGNWHAIELTEACVLGLTAVANAKGCSLVVEVLQDSTGDWPLDLSVFVNATELEAEQVTTADTTAFLIAITRDGGSTWYGFWAGGSGGGASLSAAAISALGFVGPILMEDGVTSPPVPLETEDGTDWLYADL